MQDSQVPDTVVSIRAPREGRDVALAVIVSARLKFQSARPVKGATYCVPALRVWRMFQSARPVKGATWRGSLTKRRWRFQSARPVKGATWGTKGMAIFWDVSIRAPREGRDPDCDGDGTLPW